MPRAGRVALVSMIRATPPRGGVARWWSVPEVALLDGEGHVGYGECPPFHLPFYSEETLAGARDLIERVLLPRVTGREFDAGGVGSFVREQGDGDPVVLMHGIPVSSFLYRKVLPLLAERGLRPVPRNAVHAGGRQGHP